MELTISRLNSIDSGKVFQLLTATKPEYSRYFTPFSFDLDTISHLLKSAIQDCYWGMHLDEELAGFFMLRGFDSGYQRPSFGVFIAERFSNNSLSSLALQYSLSWCKLNNISRIMLKVHPENKFARRAYEKAGFQLLEVLPDSGQLLFEKQLQ